MGVMLGSHVYLVVHVHMNTNVHRCTLLSAVLKLSQLIQMKSSKVTFSISDCAHTIGSPDWQQMNKTGLLINDGLFISHSDSDTKYTNG